ncbi:hypothetical protein M752DRAFT_95616 [Aspergillus phoenicis ATCC 13157]|uniref:F-box domain-containing protein n=1 Tax=Aspergillus phoenicis ATCC 13157 TaxID=1353007 RepID=A0A370PVQ9_ASPPH|nr:hypothetical protein M752DRAFT_95616 [Aspergillus phoenicis ATCC 13157]
MLDRLPLELLHMVLDHVTRRDLKNLCEVSKNIYVKMVPCLYESLIIKATYPSAQSVNDAITRSNHSQLVHTKHLRLWGSYHEIEAYQFCSLHDFLDDRLQAPGDVDGPMSKLILCGDQQTTTFDCIPIMTHNMYRMVSGIPQGQLQSFQWDLKTCFSDEVVLLINRILETQENLTTISLLTDGDCIVTRIKYAPCAINLAQLSKLQHLSWRGLKRYVDFESVRQFIAAHGAQLKTLHLDLIGWDTARLAWRQVFRRTADKHAILPQNFFAQCVLGLPLEEKSYTLLTALQRLTLSQVSFSPMEVQLTGALNVGQLQALQLINCPGTFRFLRQIVHSGMPLKLKLLELTFNPEKLNQITDESQDNITETVKAFLEAFSGLIDLYLMLPTVSWDGMCQSMLHHKSTLRRLITHGLWRTEVGFQQDGDLFGSPEFRPRISHDPGLEFLGISASISEMCTITGDHGLSPTIEVLHIRASGPMLRERIPDNSVAYDVLPSYAEWAFGREGYLHLQVLAYGDFSHDGCYNDYNRLWYRTGRYGFKVLKPSDAKFWDLVQEYKDVLGACAFDELFLERGIPR